MCECCFFFFSSRRRHTRWTGDWSSDVCSSDLAHYLSIGGYAIVAIVVVVVGAFIIYRLREIRKEAAVGRMRASIPPEDAPSPDRLGWLAFAWLAGQRLVDELPKLR